MTTYAAIEGREIDAESPITDLLLTRFRDNPIAIAEADSSVPAGLLPTVHLGTLTTTTGTTQTLSNLVLTPYKFLRMVWNGVSHNDPNTNRFFSVASSQVTSTVTSGTRVSGFIDIDLNSEIAVLLLSDPPIGTSTGDLNINNAATSIAVSVSGGASFDAGSIRFYGIK